LSIITLEIRSERTRKKTRGTDLWQSCVFRYNKRTDWRGICHHSWPAPHVWGVLPCSTETDLGRL